jgi:uroporphyrinogen-III synthase
MASSTRYIISTRPKRQNNELKQLLEKQGYTLLELPMIEIHRRVRLSHSDFKKLENIQQYNWIVFTSPNGIRHFFHHYKNTSGTNSLPENIKTAVVGTTTQKILEEHGTSPPSSTPGIPAKNWRNSCWLKLQKPTASFFRKGT